MHAGLASELLGRKYSVPEPKSPTSVLSRHETGLFIEAERVLSSLGGYETHRGQAFNNHILPKCRPLIEAIGQRMAYEAAKVSGCDSSVLFLYEKLCMFADLSWYTENLITTRSDFFKSMDEAYANALPNLLCNLEKQKQNLKGFIHAPIVTEESWVTFLHELKAYSRNASPKL